jgi:GNAT superfamily N-acetyltransferase
MAEDITTAEPVVADATQQPTPVTYVDKVYAALKDNLAGFKKTPEEFKAAMKDSAYASKAYQALKDNLTGFDKAPDTFYEQVGVKKKAGTPVVQSTSQPLPNGGITDQNSLIGGNNQPHAPIIDPNQQQSQAIQSNVTAKQALSNQLKGLYDKLDPETQKNFDRAQQLATNKPQDVLRGHTSDEIAHEDYMKTPVGKTLGALTYLGSKATKGTLQVAKGAAWLASMEATPAMMGENPTVDKAFDKADKVADFGLTKSDEAHMEDNKLVGNLGGLAEFLPAAAAGEATGGATFYLQGLGQGKETIDKAEKESGQTLNPLVKNAFILGTGAVNGLLMGDLGKGIFGKLPAGLRQDIVANISADAIKKSAGKEITGDVFKQLLNDGAKTFADKLATGGINALKTYNKAAVDLSALQGADFALKKGVNATTDQPVFHDTAGNLAEGIQNTLTQTAPMFALGGAAMSAGKLFPNSQYKNTAVESLMHDPSDANLNQVKQDLQQIGQAHGWSPAETDATLQQADKIHSIVKQLPRNLPESKRGDAVDLIAGRNELKDHLKYLQDHRATLDESVKDIPSPEETLLQDKIDQANDKLRGIATGKPVTYSKGVDDKEEGKFFKTIDGKKEEIPQSRYDLENIEREHKANDKKELTNEAPISPVSEGQVSPVEAAPQNEPSDVPAMAGQADEVKSKADRFAEDIGATEKDLRHNDAGITGYSTKENSPVRIELETRSGKPNDVNLSWIEVPESEQGKGIGKSKLKEITESADKHGLSLNLSVVKEANDADRLLNLYKSFGFEESAKQKNKELIKLERQPSELKKPRAILKPDGTEYSASELKTALDNIENGAVKLPDHITKDIIKNFYEYKLKEEAKNEPTTTNPETAPDVQGQPEQQVSAPKNSEAPVETPTKQEANNSPINKSNNESTNEKGGSQESREESSSENANGKESHGNENGQKEVSKQGDTKVEPVATKPKSLTDDELNRKLELRKKFAGRFNDITNIPTLLADKEFREYAGLVFKEATGDFKQFSKELIDNVGEKIKEHLQGLYDELKGNEPIGITKEETRKQRELRGLEDVPAADRTTLSNMFDEGKSAIENKEVDAPRLAAEVADKPRNLSSTEVNALLYDRQLVRQEISSIYQQLAERITDRAGMESTEVLQERQRFLESQLDTNERALRAGANKNALALVAMRNMINADYSLAEQSARMRSLAGGELTPAMKSELDRYAKELDEANKKLADYERAAVEKKAKAAIAKDLIEARKNKKRGDIETINKKIADTIDDFLAQRKKRRTSGEFNSVGKASAEFLIDAAPFMKKMVPLLIEKGVVEFKDIVAAIHEKFAEHIDDLTDRDVMDALSGKHDEKKQTQSELTREKYHIKRLAQLTTKLEDLRKGEQGEKNERKLVQKRKDIEQLENEIKDIEKELGPTPEERNKESLRRQLDRINERIKNKDFAKPEGRPKVEADAEAITLNAKVNKARNNFDAMADRLASHNKSKYEKALTTYTAIRRAMLLSGVKTLGKLYAFAAGRSITTPIEEAVNSLNNKIPGLRKIADRSPRFSGGLSPKAEALAITTRWSKATLKDSWVDVLKSGAGELDRMYGKNGTDKDFELNPSALEFFGRLHGAFKNSTKRAEFFRSFQKRLEYASKNGEDINDPNVQFSKGLEAYADAKRAILMNDNIIVDKGYKNALRGIEQGGGATNKTIATAIRALFPIVKIPTNYVLETYDATTGAIPGLSRATPYIVKAMLHGAESLSPKQADMVMRTLAKGQIGLAAMIIAYCNPKMFGGYYSGKRKDDDLKAGDIVIDGFKLPHWMSHNPFFASMQVAATMRRAIDAANGNGAPDGVMNQLTTKKKDEISAGAIHRADKANPNAQVVEVQDGKQFYEVVVKNGRVTGINKEGGFKQGVVNSGKGLLEQIPFTSAGDLLNNQKSAGNIAGEMARNQVEPRLLQEAAEFTDKRNGEPIKRDPQTFGEQMKMGVPGLRQEVAEKAAKTDATTERIHMDNGTVYKLTPEQAKEREELNAQFLKNNEARIRKLLAGKKLTEHDIQLKLKTIANRHTKPIMLKKYRTGTKINLELLDE